MVYNYGVIAIEKFKLVENLFDRKWKKIPNNQPNKHPNRQATFLA